MLSAEVLHHTKYAVYAVLVFLVVFGFGFVGLVLFWFKICLFVFIFFFLLFPGLALGW